MMVVMVTMCGDDVMVTVIATKAVTLYILLSLPSSV